jgi:hypothetical protein
MNKSQLAQNMTATSQQSESHGNSYCRQSMTIVRCAACSGDSLKTQVKLINVYVQKLAHPETNLRACRGCTTLCMVDVRI